MAAEVGKPASPISRTLTLGAATEVEVAVTAFAPLLELLEAVPDPRRAEGKVYRLPHVLLFSILAIVSGGNSYRSVATFTDERRRRLNRTFGLTWRRAPAHTSIRNILQGLDSGALEAVFRRAMPACYRRPAPSRARPAWRSMARRCAAASTSSATAPPHKCSASSPPTPRWCWRTATLTKSPTRSRPPRRCSASSASLATWSHSMPCIAKEDIRSRC